MIVVTKTDIAIQEDVLAELEWDPQVDRTEIGVTVDDGVVTLTGTLTSYAKKQAAERAAQRVDGVRAVANDLSVKSAGGPTDTQIAKAVADALEANSLLPPGRIEVTVKNGKVTLTGEVIWDYERTAATGTVLHLAGVRDVINKIAIKQPKVSEIEVKRGIEQALVRAAEVDAAHVMVHAVDGAVHLTGTVRSWPEKQAAASAAWKAKGVRRVVNEIEVRPN